MKRNLAATAVCACGLLMLSVANNSVNAADADAGKDAFAKRCSGCHALDSDKEGPRLRGVFGRKAGTVESFQYSEELRKSGIVWDQPLLTRWLEDPQKVVPNTNMEFRVISPEERSAIVTYLKSLATP
jgi:cytochrome c